MSEAAESAVRSAGEIEAEAARWLERRDFDVWTDADEKSLEAWLQLSLHHRVSFDRLDLGWQCTGRLTVLRHANPFPSKPSAVSSRSYFRQIVVAAAAAIAAVGGWLVVSAERQVTYATSVGGREIIRMVDGSQIELNTDTAIRISDRTNRREVWLDRGEAYFQVEHDSAHPFVVNAGNRRVTDLGTKFSVRRESDRLKVAVSEGGVRLEARTGSVDPNAVVLKPGEVAIATPTSIRVQKEDAKNLKEDLSWRSGVLTFHRTRLADAVAEFNRYNHRQLLVTDPVIARLEIGGTFPTTDVEGFAEVSRDVLRLRVTRDGEVIRISR